MNPLNIAITGANGYIGAYLTHFFEQQGHRVLKLCRPQFVLSHVQVAEALTSVEVLIHCAYDFSETDYDKSYVVNVNGSEALFEQAQQAGVKKVIYFSSTSTFAEAVSHYGKIKYAIEQLALQKNFMVLRPGLV